MKMSTRKETERAKLLQEKCQTLLTQMLRDEDNKYCVDCDAKGPRWASWNLGVFLCIRCAGIHRNLGVHISRVKSVNLDTWTPEQVVSLQQMGNSRARAVYEAQLPDGFRRPQTDTALESFIRAKYEHKKYLAREWVPPPPPKVDWAKEIDEEIEKQKRKKKASQTASALGNIASPLGGGSDKKLNSSAKSQLPAPLPKPKSSNSPKTHRNESNHAASSDLLGLSSPTNSSGPFSVKTNDLQGDSFTGFLSAPPSVSNGPTSSDNNDKSSSVSSGVVANSLAKEEEDFFNQGSLTGDRDKSGKLTKDSILALYGTGPTNPPNSLGQFNNNPLVGFNSTFMTMSGPSSGVTQTQQTFPAGLVGAAIGGNQFGQNMNLAGMPPGLLGPPQQPQTQFMAPPNSTTMYNAPVMTAPVAFTSVPHHHHPQMGVQQSGGFAQFPSLQSFGAGGLPSAFGGGIMATGQGQITPNLAAPPQSAANTSANLSQQFGNLNIGNVWQ